MNTLYLLVASDLLFAMFIYWAYRDHNMKMDALYEKYDKETTDEEPVDRDRQLL